MKLYYFQLAFSYREFLPYYQGKVSVVSVLTVDGIRVQFPAMHLRTYLTASGISGHFCLTTENNKFKSLKKIV